MKCIEHSNEAVAVCSNCGVALCKECSNKSASGKYCCSDNCLQQIAFTEGIAELTLERATKASMAGAYGSYLLGLVFLGFAVWGLFNDFMAAVIYMGLFGCGMVAMGYFYQRSAKSKIPVNKSSKRDAVNGVN